ncbi:J domain-containing protein [Bdellovibrio svalbardensis]|uniref:J domain-containing protein n=1 Tax=Bdellovibrio svalbardensis TaxID=2972972 RepID=A0ABT6DLH7_9BACT|nr:J domain-containing protein [Bdellovibrio svalbardensis]MDG0817732.1 J domain-containing protein [Bdellovibrio svalbardensis]
MSFQASFKQILNEKMNGSQTSHDHSSSEKAADLNSDPANLAYLMGHIGRFEFQMKRGQYAAPKVRPQRKPHNFSTHERLSYEFLKTWVHDLPEGFTDSELKKAFRQAAMILHPDQGGNTTQFMELKEHYTTLKALLAAR